MIQHEFTRRETLRFSGGGAMRTENTWAGLLRLSLPSEVSGGSDTYVIDSTTVSKQGRTIIKAVRCETVSSISGT
jgi:hypothetical protein